MPLTLLHFVYGDYSTLDVSTTKKAQVHILLSDKKTQCTKDDAMIGGTPFAMSTLERELWQKRINRVLPYYKAKTPCKDWGEVFIANEGKEIVGSEIINMPKGDETLKNKTIFVFIEGESYENDLERTIEK